MLNVRDLGARRTVDGHTRVGVLVRGGLTGVFGGPADGGRQFGTVVDLRTSREIDRDGTSPWIGAGEHVHRSIDGDWDLLRRTRRPSADDFAAAYRSLLGPALRVAGYIVTATDRSSGPVLFGCTLGKDRTGVVAAVLLRLAGVATDDIVDDYLESTQPLHDAADGLEQMWSAKGHGREDFLHRTRCHRSVIEDLLQAIGDVDDDALVEAMGLGAADADRFRSRFVVPEPVRSGG